MDDPANKVDEVPCGLGREPPSSVLVVDAVVADGPPLAPGSPKSYWLMPRGMPAAAAAVVDTPTVVPSPPEELLGDGTTSPPDVSTTAVGPGDAAAAENPSASASQL